MTRSQITKQVNRKICGLSKGIFSDEYWNGIKPITDFLNDSEHEFYLDSAVYKHDENGTPIRKEWVYKSDATKKPVVVLIIASGAGTVSDPLSKYDVICYAS